MKIMLSDPIVEVDGWRTEMNELGAFKLKQRKTPEQIKQERQLLRDKYGADTKRRINPMISIPHTCITLDKDDQGKAYFLPGLWPRVKNYLDTMHIEYTVEDKRNPDIRPKLDYSAFKGVELRKDQDTLIALVSMLDCGIFECPTGFGKSLLISLLCKAYPTLNIVITTSSVQVVETLYEYLCKQIPGQVGILGGGKELVAGKRVIVSTLKSLSNIPPEKVQLLFVDECHSVGLNTAGQVLMQFMWARRFGFSASPIRNDGTGRMLEAILGPVVLKVSYQEATDNGMVTPMKYLMLPCTQCPNIAKSPSIPEVVCKRWSYWANNSRNNAVRQFVYQLKKVYDGQILIMVDTLEHLVHLHRLLPFFTPAYYGKSDMADLRKKFPKEKYPGLNLDAYSMNEKQLNRVRGAFAKGTLRYVISTKVFRQGVNFSHLSVLIRADGTVSGIEGIQVPGRLSRLDEDKPVAYLIDIADMFSPWAENRYKARVKLYNEQGWSQTTMEEMLDDLGRRPKTNSKEPVA